MASSSRWQRWRSVDKRRLFMFLASRMAFSSSYAPQAATRRATEQKKNLCLKTGQIVRMCSTVRRGLDVVSRYTIFCVCSPTRFLKTTLFVARNLFALPTKTGGIEGERATFTHTQTHARRDTRAATRHIPLSISKMSTRLEVNRD